MQPLGIAIIGVILINGVFSFWQEYRAERALEALRRFLPEQIKAMRIAHLTQTTEEQPSSLQREIARLSYLVAALAAGLGLVFFLIGQAVGLPFWANFMFAIGIIVANVPEGLLPTVTLALVMSAACCFAATMSASASCWARSMPS